MNRKDDLAGRILNLLQSQKLGVLSTYSGKDPYASLVAFNGTDDLKHLYFVTGRATRKFANLKASERVALLVDSRSNDAEDFHNAAAVTILGKASEIAGEEREDAAAAYLNKHPYLADFVASPSCALLKIVVNVYILVENFQQVMELHMTHEDDPNPE